jgi:flagellar biogenesis protein FliO
MTNERRKLLLMLAALAAVGGCMLLLAGRPSATAGQEAAGGGAVVSRPASVGEEAVLKRSAAREEQPLKRTGDGGGGWQQTLLALAAVAALIFVARALLKRTGAGRSARDVSGAVAVLGRVPMAPRHQLALVRLGERIVLVGMSPEGLSALGEVKDPAEVSRLMERIEGAKPASPAPQKAE